MQTWRREYFTTPPQIVAVDQIETCKQMVVHGVGRSVLPKTVIRDLNADDFEITPLFIADQPFVRPTWLITEGGALALPQVAAFVEMALTDLIHH
ncbi:LysR substrate-binding domain-containing protein [Amphibacillus sediminis]|uniref:LysR substrate-binding domain-containing protein n=1 Tax=Amphibacillus sediminis TaxID=360185 RepID=UPI0009FA65D1